MTWYPATEWKTFSVKFGSIVIYMVTANEYQFAEMWDCGKLVDSWQSRRFTE